MRNFKMKNQDGGGPKKWVQEEYSPLIFVSYFSLLTIATTAVVVVVSSEKKNLDNKLV